jgi:hypothetical protein
MYSFEPNSGADRISPSIRLKAGTALDPVSIMA